MASSFHNRARAAQLVDFKGLQWGKCRCTDIDISVDWQGRTFVFTEIKSEGAPLTAGQKYHLEGLVKAIRAGGKVAYAVVAHHQTKVTEDIQAAQCRTAKVYDGTIWHPTDTNERLSDTLNMLYQEHLERGKSNAND